MRQRAGDVAGAGAPGEAYERTAGLREEAGRLLVTVRVTPRASRNELTFADGVLHVRLTAPPVEGAANAALIAELAERLGLPRRAIHILRGTAARHKTVALDGLSADGFQRKISG